MRDRYLVLRTALVLVAGFLVTVLAGCGGGGGGGSIGIGGPTAPTTGGSGNTAVGSAACSRCHITFPYSNGYNAGDPMDSNVGSSTYLESAGVASVAVSYANSVHNTPPQGGTDVVTCEGCHGNGSQHYGVGPIPYYRPGIAQCEACHNGAAATAVVDPTLFAATAHANPANSPDKYFFQGGVGGAQADIRGQLEWMDLASTVPVNKTQHIEECSVCHAPGQKQAHITNNDVADPPQVACNSCHDPHQPSASVRNYTLNRATGTGEAQVATSFNLNLKPLRVNNVAGVAQFGAQNTNSGTWIRPRLTFDYHVGGVAANTYSGYAKQTTVGDWLRLSSERLCAGCHTTGNYKYGVQAGGTAVTTHQADTFTQYLNSGHAAINDPAWLEFSLKAALAGTHRPQYPQDMGGKVGQNGTTVPFDGRINGGQNNFDCMQCHNGIGAIDYINGTVGGVALGDSQKAHILWGDSSVTCVTCHDPHKSAGTTSKNVRVPVAMSYNAEFKPNRAPNGVGNARGSVNKMLDLTDVPTGLGNNAVCVFCHQGRESGWTAWNKVRWTRLNAPNNDSATLAANRWYDFPNTTITAAGVSFVNDHYLAAASLLYSKNANEFIGQTYSDGIPEHQAQGCTSCHMGNPAADNSVGGHTWKPNVNSCGTCHTGLADFHSVPAAGDWNGNGVVETAFAELGTPTFYPASGVVTVQYGTGNGGTGLLGRLNEALMDAGIRWNGDTYSYMFVKNTSTAFKAFTPNLLSAAMNAQAFYKSGAAGEQALYVHNPYYAAQILIDSLNALGYQRSGTGNTGTAFVRPGNPPGGSSHAGADYRTRTP